MKQMIRPAVIFFIFFALLTGVLYPLTATGLAQVLFGAQANGSLILKEGQVVGSRWIGQWFDAPEYFWPRLSATSGVPYNAASSAGSNLSVQNTLLKDQAAQRIAQLQQNNAVVELVPVDLVTASASGLDPHISPAAAAVQVERVAKARGLAREMIVHLIDKHTEGRFLGLFGEARVNVVELNLAMDALQ